MERDGPPAIVLLSGGLDSATTLALAREQGYRVFALTVDYGQRHALEIDRARAIAAQFGAEEHRVIRVDLSHLAGSALTDPATAVPVDRSDAEMESGVPSTYVPARNALFLCLALGWAEVVGAGDLFLGVNAVDYSGYPDCRPEFLDAFERLARLATRDGTEERASYTVHAPLLRRTKGEIVREALRLGVDPATTLSCYEPDAAGGACGRCDSCRLRERGFREVGVSDPAGPES